MVLFYVVHPYGLGVYQALGVAKTWSQKARIPSIPEMWKEYPGAGRDLPHIIAMGEGSLSFMYPEWRGISPTSC